MNEAEIRKKPDWKMPGILMKSDKAKAGRWREYG